MKSVVNRIKTFLDNSSLPAVVVDERFRSVWYNNTYGKTYSPFKDINGFSLKFPDFDVDKIKSLLSLPDGGKISGGKITILKSGLPKRNLYLLSLLDYISDDESESDISQIVFEHYPRPYVIFSSHDGTIKNTNRRLAALFSIPEEHLRTMTIKQILNDGEGCVMDSYMTGDSLYSKPFLTYFTDEEDNKRFIEVEAFPVKDDLIFFDMHDITSDMHFQTDTLKDSFRYSFLYKHISDGVIIWQDNKIIDINSAACQIWGYTKDEIAGSNISSLFESEIDRSMFAAHLKPDEAIKTTFKGIKKDKTRFSGEIVSKSFDLINGTVYIAVVNDLTEHQKFLEMEREKKNIEDNILNSQRNLVMVYDDNGDLIKCNNAFLDFFVCSSINDFKCKYGSVEQFFVDEPGFIDSSYGKFWFKKIANDSKAEYKIIIENIYDKEEHIFFANANNMTFDNTSYVVTLSDITETVQASLALKDANSLLLMFNENVKSEMEINMDLLAQQTKLAMLGEMIGIITHQWKQPLNAIGLIAQNIEDILEEDENIDREEIASMMGSIMRYVMSMGETVDNFRDFFKNTNTSKLFNLRKAIDSALLLLQPVLKKSSVTVNLNTIEQYDDFMIRGSANEFKQVILNIVINAKDAILTKINRGDAEFGSGVVEINIEKHAVEKIRIVIKDNGTGLSPHDISNIFNMQYSTKGDAGTGIGMYMSDMIIKKMGGRIWADNWEKGAALFIEIPVQC